MCLRENQCGAARRGPREINEAGWLGGGSGWLSAAAWRRIGRNQRSVARAQWRENGLGCEANGGGEAAAAGEGWRENEAAACNAAVSAEAAYRKHRINEKLSAMSASMASS